MTETVPEDPFNIFTVVKNDDPAEIAEYLNKYPHHINVLDPEGKTPLFHVKSLKSLQVVLATKRIDVYFKDRMGKSAIEYRQSAPRMKAAIRRRCEEIDEMCKSFTGPPKCLGEIHVNNQVGALHSVVRDRVAIWRCLRGEDDCYCGNNCTCKPFEFEVLKRPKARCGCGVGNGVGAGMINYRIFTEENKPTNVLYMENVIPVEMAKRVRSFLHSIPFDKSIKELNDVDNPPKKSVWESCRTATESSANSDVLGHGGWNDEKLAGEWMWEKYQYYMWRAAPLTLKSFVLSPLYGLIEILEKKWRATKMPLDMRDTVKVVKLTWVVQRTDIGYYCGPHLDEHPYGRIAFIYYLTSDDWDHKKDGGHLSVKNSENVDDWLDINPKFNSIVAWNMTKGKSPLHWVNHVRAPSDRPRIALVGFWNEAEQK